jgi:hypothetical protein
MDIKDALDAADIEYKPGSDDDEIFICCPFCMEEGEQSLDDRFRLGINIENGKANCFNCSKHSGGGDYIFDELQRVLDTGEMEAKRHRKKKRKKVKRMLPDGFQLLKHPSEDDDKYNNICWRYVRGRGVSENQIRDKKIGYTLIEKYHHRIIMPIYRHERLLGFVGRDFTDNSQLKYMNSEGEKLLYNIPDKACRSACLSEGAFDALVIERSSRKLSIDSLSVLGHTLTEPQLDMLIELGYKTLYFWFDPDSAGMKGIINNYNKFPKGIVPRIILPRGFEREGATDADPSELERNEITNRLAVAPVCTESVVTKLRAWMAFSED